MSNLTMWMLTNLCIRLVLLVTLAFLPSNAQAQAQAQASCSKFSFEAINSKMRELPTSSFKTCVDLPVLESYLHWNYHPAAATLEIAYRHAGIPPTSSKWVAWAINPTSKTMVGSQALVAYHKPDGTVVAHTAPISGYGTELAEGKLSFNVSGLTAVSVNDEVVIFATIKVPNNATVLNQVWQDGPLSADSTPKIHSTAGPNVRSMASLDLLSGVSAVAVAAPARPAVSLRNIHGVLNGVSWGIMMPIGAIIARHKAVFSDPAWFYLHVGCQLSAYIIGAAGWATGIKLGNDSIGIIHPTHRNIGITLFIFGTLQVFALLLRPKKDHKYRFCWNIYHHTIGYSVIILSIVNILKGFEILNPDQVWMSAYIAVIVVLAVIAAGLEVFALYAASHKKRSEVIDGDSKPSEGQRP